jgi:GntR family transcriptional regulator
LHRLESFTEDMQARALVPSSKTLVFDIVPAPDSVAARLGLPPREPVLYLKRLRLVGGHPVALHDTYVNRTDLQQDELEAVGSLYTLLEQKGIELFEADETLEAIMADDEMAHLLNISRGAPILKATRLTWDRQHIPVELVTASYRADFYRYAVRLRR